MYYIVYCDIDGRFRAIIDTAGKPNKYGKPKLFQRKKDALAWIEWKTYAGMTHYYEVKKAA